MTRPDRRYKICALTALLLIVVPIVAAAQDGDFNDDYLLDCTDGQYMINCLEHPGSCDPELLDLSDDGYVTWYDLEVWFELCAADPTCHAKIYGVPGKCVTTAFYVDASVYLEGPFTGSQMTTTLAQSGQIPMQHPFSVGPWSYAGSESVAAVGNTVVDWVHMRLLSGDPFSPPMTLEAERAALLLENGAIVETTGSGPVLFETSPDSTSHYLVVESRNHISVMSSDTLDVISGVATWDFRSSPSNSFSAGGTPQKSLAGGKYGLFACDVNVDGQVTAPDFNLWNASTTAGEAGYQPADCNMDGLVTAPDFNLWNANTTAGAASQVPD